MLAPLAALALAGQPVPVQGNPDSPVRVLIYEDLQCPDCAAFDRMLHEHLLPRYGAKVAFVHRDFPLAKHAWARQAAIAARFFAQRDPKVALAYRSQTLVSRREITPGNFDQRLAAFAEKHGIPGKDAVAALADPRYAEAVEKDFQEGVARGVSKTPTVFVNGAPFVETFTLEEISKGIDQALAQAN